DVAEAGGSMDGVVAQGFAEGLALIATSCKVLAVPSPDMHFDAGEREMGMTAHEFGGDHAASVRDRGLGPGIRDTTHDRLLAAVRSGSSVRGSTERSGVTCAQATR